MGILMSVVSGQIVRQLKYYASEFRELRRYNGLEDAEYSLLGKLGSTLSDAFDTNAMPSPILDAIAANHTELQDSDRRANCLVKLVIGFQGEPAGPDRMNVVFIGPGYIMNVWPEVFAYAWCYDTNDHEISQTITTALVKHRFEIFGMYATACELLAEWIENHADDDHDDHDNPIPPGDGLHCDDTVFVWGGKTYTSITPAMGPLLKVLMSAYRQGRDATLPEFEAVAGEIKDGFGRCFDVGKHPNRSKHPVWELIKGGRGKYRLIDPVKAK